MQSRVLDKETDKLGSEAPLPGSIWWPNFGPIVFGFESLGEWRLWLEDVVEHQ